MDEHLYNCRAFARYMALDKKVTESAPSFHELKNDSRKTSRTRKPPTVFNTTTSDDSPRKKRFVVNLDSSSREDGSLENEDDGNDDVDDDVDDDGDEEWTDSLYDISW